MLVNWYIVPNIYAPVFFLKIVGYNFRWRLLRFCSLLLRRDQDHSVCSADTVHGGRCVLEDLDR